MTEPIRVNIAGHPPMNFPEGTSQEIIQATVKRIVSGNKTQAPAEATTAEKIAGHPATRFALGVAEPFLGAMQAANYINPTARLLGDRPFGDKWFDSQIKETQKLKNAGMKAAGNEGFDVAGLAGNVASPGGWKAASKMVPAASFLGKAGQGSAMGAAQGASMPVYNGNFAETKAEQTVGGAAVGAAIQPIVAVGKMLGVTYKAVRDMLSKQGPERLFDEYLSKIIGPDPVVRQKIIAALKQADEIVPGSKPTASEAISDIPGASPIQAHQAQISKASEGPSGLFGQRTVDQQAARSNALQGVGKTPEELVAAKLLRKENAINNYGKAYDTFIKSDPKLLELSKDPFFKKALPDAIELAKSEKISTKKDLTKFLHYVKIGLDRQLLPNSNNAITNTQKEAIYGVKQRLLDWMKANNPKYDTARRQFAEESKLMDRMKVGQNLQKKLVSSTEKETPSSFTNALREEVKSLKNATGTSRYNKLSELMSPQETKTINNVLADVVRHSKSLNPAQKTSLGGVSAAESTSIQLPNLLSRPAMIANYALRNKNNKIEQAIEKIAAENYLDPKKLAAMLDKYSPKQKSKVQNALMMMMDSKGPLITGTPIYAGSQGQ